MFKGQTNIDDVCAELLTLRPWDAISIAMVWTILKEQYSRHGYELDSSKFGISCHKLYLGPPFSVGNGYAVRRENHGKVGLCAPFSFADCWRFYWKAEGAFEFKSAELALLMLAYNLFTSLACVKVFESQSTLSTSRIMRRILPWFLQQFCSLKEMLILQVILQWKNKNQCSRQEPSFLFGMDKGWLVDISASEAWGFSYTQATSRHCRWPWPWYFPSLRYHPIYIHTYWINTFWILLAVL